MFLSLLIILIIVLIAGAVFLAPDKPGDDSSALMQGLAHIRSMTKDADNEKTTTTVYKWQDADGEWHFSNTPPPQGVASKIQTYRSDINTIQPPRQSPRNTEQRARQPRQASSSPSSQTPGFGALDAATKALNDARAVQGLNDDRMKTLDAQIDAND